MAASKLPTITPSNVNQLLDQHKITPDQAVLGTAKYTQTHPSSVENAANSVGNTVNSVTSGVGSISSFLTSTENWVRIGEVIAGLILLIMGLKTLSGGQSTIIQTAGKTAGKAVAFA